MPAERRRIRSEHYHIRPGRRRGPDYSWANSARLQRSLATAFIGYRRVKELAPTTELRHLQYREDDRQGVGKGNRIALAPEYAQALHPWDALARLGRDAATALFCVERDPEACARVRGHIGLPVTDLRPG